MWKATGKKPPQLAELPEPPESLLYCWEWWKELFTGDRLTYTEIKAWADLTGRPLCWLEVEVIRELDLIFQRHIPHG